MNNLSQDSLDTPDPDVLPASDANILSSGAAPGALPGILRRRRTGKIASLPLPIREQIKHLIQDGVPYHLIIEEPEAPGAPPLPCAIAENNLSDWKDGVYQDCGDIEWEALVGVM